MKKILLSIVFFSISLYISSQITWMGNEYSTLSGTQYLGDDILFEIQSWPMALNQGAQVYIDWSNNGYNGVLNYDYYPLTWISQVGNNSKWNSFVRMKEVGTHNRKYLGWQTSQSDYITANFGEFTVTALSNPTSTTATQNSASQIDLSWEKWNSKNVMVVRKKSTDSWTEPSQGTAYSVGNTIGSGTVVYNGSGLSYQNTGLASSTSYDYKFYSVNNDYYSAGTVTNVSTASLSSDYFRSKATGNWNSNSTWESSNNNSDWVNSTTTPTTTSVAILSSHTVSITDNLSISSLTINSGGTVEVSAAKQLTINTALTNNGTLTLKSANGVGTATLETPSSISGSGTYNVEQYLSDITSPSSFRNWYISSPVSAAAATVITGTTNNILYERNESNNTYPTATSFVAGRGYVAKIAAGNSNVYTFTGGNLNNGSVTVPISRTTSITKEGFNLVGNPFPAHLKWLQTTADTYGVMTTIWYRTYNSGYSFQTYNAQGDMGVPLDASGYIPPMQAFWVRKIAAGSGNLTLNSTNAVHRSDNPLRAPAQKSGVPNKILRLEVQSNANVDEALIYFNANAANNFDGFDSPKWFNLNDTIPEIYTVADAEKLVINGLNSIQLDTEIPLGFRTGNISENHNFKLKATQLQNFGTETELVLIDKGITPTETVLNEGTEYSFNSLAVNSTDRFSLVFRAKGSTTGGCCFGTFENKVRIQKNDNNQLVVNCDNYALKNANLTVYNAAGQKLIEQSITESRTTINLALKTGVYLVKLQSEGKIYNVKVAI